MNMLSYDRQKNQHDEYLATAIMIWSAHNDTVNNINSLSLKVLAASACLAACSGGSASYLVEYHADMEDTLLMKGSFLVLVACLGAASIAAHISAGIWSINFLLLLYTKYHLAALKAMKEPLGKTQESV